MPVIINPTAPKVAVVTVADIPPNIGGAPYGNSAMIVVSVVSPESYQVARATSSAQAGELCAVGGGMALAIVRTDNTVAIRGSADASPEAMIALGALLIEAGTVVGRRGERARGVEVSSIDAVLSMQLGDPNDFLERVPHLRAGSAEGEYEEEAVGQGDTPVQAPPPELPPEPIVSATRIHECDCHACRVRRGEVV